PKESLFDDSSFRVLEHNDLRQSYSPLIELPRHQLSRPIAAVKGAASNAKILAGSHKTAPDLRSSYRATRWRKRNPPELIPLPLHRVAPLSCFRSHRHFRSADPAQPGEQMIPLTKQIGAWAKQCASSECVFAAFSYLELHEASRISKTLPGLSRFTRCKRRRL